MNVVSTSRSPSAPGVVFADRSTQGMAVRSGVTLSTTVPTALLPSATCATSESAAKAATMPASSRRLDREDHFRPRVAARGSAFVFMSSPSVYGPALGPSYRWRPRAEAVIPARTVRRVALLEAATDL